MILEYMFVLPTLFPDYTFKMNMAWGRELIFSYNFLSPLLSSCVSTILWLQGHARRVGLCYQKQLPTHFQTPLPVWERHLFTYCSFLLSFLPYRRQQC